MLSDIPSTSEECLSNVDVPADMPGENEVVYREGHDMDDENYTIENHEEPLNNNYNFDLVLLYTCQQI